MAEIVPLKLTTNPAAANIMLGNGEIIANLVAEATATFGDQTKDVSIVLDETSNDNLVGTAFLRAFNLAFVFIDTVTVLVDKETALEIVAKWMEAAPPGLPNITPGVHDE
jgi:hypothetical protein